MTTKTNMGRLSAISFLILSMNCVIHGLPLQGVEGEYTDGQPPVDPALNSNGHMFPENMPPPPPGAFNDGGGSNSYALPLDNAAPPADAGPALMAGPVLPQSSNMFPDNMPLPPPGALNDEVPQVNKNVLPANGDMFPPNMPPPPPGAMNDGVPQVNKDVLPVSGDMFPPNMPPPPPGAMNDGVPQVNRETLDESKDMNEESGPSEGKPPFAENANPSNAPVPTGKAPAPRQQGMFPPNMPPPPPGAYAEPPVMKSSKKQNFYAPDLPPSDAAVEPVYATVNQVPDAALPPSNEQNPFVNPSQSVQDPNSQSVAEVPLKDPAVNDALPPYNPENAGVAVPYNPENAAPAVPYNPQTAVSSGDQGNKFDPSAAAPAPSADETDSGVPYNPEAALPAGSQNMYPVADAAAPVAPSNPSKTAPDTPLNADNFVPPSLGNGPDTIDPQTTDESKKEDQPQETVPEQGEQMIGDDSGVEHPQNEESSRESSFKESIEEGNGVNGDSFSEEELQGDSDMPSEDWEESVSESETDYSFMDMLGLSDYSYEEQWGKEDDSSDDIGSDMSWFFGDSSDDWDGEREPSEIEASPDGEEEDDSSDDVGSDMNWLFGDSSDDWDGEWKSSETEASPDGEEENEWNEEMGDENDHDDIEDEAENANYNEKFSNEFSPEFVNEDLDYQMGGTRLILYCIPALILTLLVLLAWRNYRGKIRVVSVSSGDQRQYDWRADRKADDQLEPMLSREERDDNY